MKHAILFILLFYIAIPITCVETSAHQIEDRTIDFHRMRVRLYKLPEGRKNCQTPSVMNLTLLLDERKAIVETPPQFNLGRLTLADMEKLWGPSKELTPGERTFRFIGSKQYDRETFYDYSLDVKFVNGKVRAYRVRNEELKPVWTELLTPTET